jgi:hypothetical protein
MKLLCISNGHGEDMIALHILKALRQSRADWDLSALPIAGAGTAYRSADIPIVGPTQVLPSGGFLNRDPKQLARDVQKGLLPLTKQQLSAIKTWAKTGDVILAVGDIVPLLFAYLSSLPYAFVGTAKSEYWLRDERGKLPATHLLEKLEGWSGSVYLPWERWLMARSRAVFVRDALTATQLQRLSVPAHYAGNPMMDDLESTGKLKDLLDSLCQSTAYHPPQAALPNPLGPDKARATALYVTQQKSINPLTIALIPGSRLPEAYENWARILMAVPGLSAAFGSRSLILLAAVAPSLSRGTLESSLSAWQSVPGAYPTYRYQNVTLLLVADAYSDCLNAADLAIATAGTATEQFVGLGKPAITLLGKGPQFTAAFAKVQARMLGPSVQTVGHPDEIGPAIAKLMSDPDRLQLIYQNGKQRMGEPGAGDRIAQQMIKTFAPES